MPEDDKEHMKFTVRTDWGGRMRARTNIRDFVIQADLPEHKLGRDEAPTPEEHFMASLGSSLLITFVHFCAHNKIEISDVKAEVRIDLEVSADERRLKSGKSVLWVQAEPSVKETVERCFDLARKHCPVSNAIGFPLELELEFEEA